MVLNRIYNFLEPDILQELRKKFTDSWGQAVFEVNYWGRWGTGLEQGSYSPVLILHIDEYQDYFRKKFSAVDSVFDEYPRMTCYMHVWLPGTQINWHHDSNVENTRLSASVYINETWNRNWGGLFLYDDDREGQGWIYPEPNSCVWFRPPVWHGTTMITNAATTPRLSIQLFFNK
jgi:hypothetical protein